MRWGDYRRSDNVEDRTEGMPEGGGGGFRFGGLHIGGGALIILVIVGMLFGINPLEMLGLVSGGGGTVQQAPQTAPPGYGPQTPQTHAGGTTSDAKKDFAAAVLGDTEDVWGAIFKQVGSRYVPPRLVLFRGQTSSACGRAVAAVGPFYCPGDRELYLDTSFFNELASRFGAPGEFAQAYVIAHEVGHHVQNLLGTMDKVQAEMARADERTAKALSVRLELQADCYAGVWGFYSLKRGIIDANDVDSGLRAAAAVGDDNIQKHTQGYVVPDSFTHGTSEQRTRWFKTGLSSGDLRDCDTFAAR
ncbi:MAG TPA: neutral zinc metallopeptidase [Casimicrobiaceae bacterium]|jgi:predicted metalloprotease|nr:neutral zinc metallopeptidase [Casimicrobiaceae bacterium]